MALPKGERVNLIKRIAAALANETRAELELTLDTFGVPHPDQWDEWSDDTGYTVLRLRYADDDTLVELHSHLYADITMGIAPVAGGPWQEGHFKLFLSHTSSHKILAKEIRERLLLYGIDTFVAHEAIKPTKAWEEEIELALSTCEGMLVLDTPDLVESEYCDQEVGFAMGRGLLIIAIMQGAKPHGFVSKWQGMPGEDGDGAARKIAAGVFDILVDHEKSKSKMAPATARRYANSTSFENARANTQRLLEIPKELWTDAMVQEVERAGVENSQISGAFWGRGRVPEAVSRHLDDLLGRQPKPAVTPSSGSQDDIPF